MMTSANREIEKNTTNTADQLPSPAFAESRPQAPVARSLSQTAVTLNPYTLQLQCRARSVERSKISSRFGQDNRSHYYWHYMH